MNLHAKLEKDRKSLVKILRNNPSFYEVDDGVIRVKYAHNTDINDKSNEPQMVLEESIGTPDIISLAIFNRRAHQNKAITPSINAISDDLMSKKIALNESLVSSLFELDTSLRTYRNKVLDSPFKDWSVAENALVNKGLSLHLVDSMRNDVLDLMEKSLFLNTDSDGNCPFNKSVHVINSIMTSLGQRKIRDAFPHMLEPITKLNQALRSAELTTPER